MINRYLRTALVAVAFAAAPAAVEAQATLGPTVAYHDDFDFGVGAAVGVPIEAINENVGFLGDFVFFFPEPDGLDYWEINANLTMDFPIEDATVVPFALAGLNIARLSVDAGVIEGSDTEMGLNIGGGIKFDVGSLRPSVGLRLELEGGDGFVIFGTVPFVLGGDD